MCENLDQENRNLVLNLYKKSPFRISIYKKYLRVYVESYPVDDKNLIKEFNKKYKKKQFIISFFF